MLQILLNSRMDFQLWLRIII